MNQDLKKSINDVLQACDNVNEMIFPDDESGHRLADEVKADLFWFVAFLTLSDDIMTSDELELNAYRFQNEPEYRIMLSDESGGEGRNFQTADELICIDLPWSANTLEQRIGRLDRIGRDKTKDVKSVIVYARDSVEGDLADIWNKGLNIFNKSQSGLEIIMND